MLVAPAVAPSLAMASVAQAPAGARIVGPRGETTPVVNEGRELQLRVVSDAGETVPATGWESDNTSVAEVTAAGIVRGKRFGFAAIRARTGGGQTATAYVPVVKVGTRNGARAEGDTRTDRSGNVYLSSPRDHVVYKVSGLAAVRPFAGKRGQAAFRDGRGKKARFNTPTALGVDNRADGGIYVADAENDCIRKLSFNGMVSVVLGAPGRDHAMTDDETPADVASMSGVRGLASVGSDLYFSDTDHHAIYYYDARTHTVWLLAGEPGTAGLANGRGRAARFQSPSSIAVNSRGTLLAIADTGNNMIRLVGLERAGGGRVTAEVVTLGESSSGRGARARDTEGVPGGIPFQSPVSVTFDGTDNIYVVDDNGASVVVRPQGGLPERVDLAQEGSLGDPASVTIRGFEALVLDESATSAELAVRSAAVGAPVIASVAPERAALEGGEQVVVDGENFAPESVVTLGDVEVTNFTLEGTRRLSFTVPEQRAPGVRTLTVRTRGGVAQRDFTIEAAPLSTLVASEITTISGGIPYLGDGGSATEVGVRMRPLDVAVDSQGNLLVADRDNHRIRRVEADSGVITTLAGTGEFGISGDDGPATSARLSFPTAVAVDGAGNVFVADTGNARIRRIDALSGAISTFAGNGEYGFGGDGGPAADATLANPEGVAVDGSGNVYISDTQNHRIRRVDASTGRIETVAGTGDDTAEIAYPGSLAVDALGNVFVATPRRATVHRVDAVGTITTVAGTGEEGFGGDGGLATRARLHEPVGVEVDGAGNLFIGDAFNDRVRRVDARGRIATVVGSGEAGFGGDGGPAAAARLAYPSGIAVSGTGDVYLADTENHRIRRMDAKSQAIETIAGASGLGPVGDGDVATSARLSTPTAIAVDSDGDLLVTDFDHNRIRRIEASTGRISTVAGTGEYGFGGDEGPATEARLARPFGVAVDADGNVFVADTDNHRIRRIDTDGTITTVAGTGEPDFWGDGGPAIEAHLHRPGALAIDGAGNMFVADTSNHRVRRIDAATGVITTVAGTGVAGLGGDAGPAVAAQLAFPVGISLDRTGNLFIADSENSRIRRVAATTGVITTVAGSSLGFGGDGGPATSAELDRPIGVVVDGAGHVFVSDTINNRVRRVAAGSGTITTVAGNGSYTYSGDGGAATAAELAGPYGLAVDRAGNLLIAAAGNHGLRAIKGIAAP